MYCISDINMDYRIYGGLNIYNIYIYRVKGRNILYNIYIYIYIQSLFYAGQTRDHQSK